MISEYATLIVGAILVNNFVLSRILGICPFLGVSKQLSTALGMGGAVIFVMTLSGFATALFHHLILVPLGLGYLQTIVFILVIAALVQIVEVLMQRFTPPLYRALGIFLPLITTNCAVLGSAIMCADGGYGIIKSTVFCSASAVVLPWRWCCLPASGKAGAGADSRASASSSIAADRRYPRHGVLRLCRPGG